MDHNTRRGTIRFEPRWLGALIVALVILQIVAPSRTWIILIAGLGATVAGSYVWARQMATRVSLTREQHYGWAHVGDLLEETFTLSNSSLLPVLWAEVDDRSELPGYDARMVRSAAGMQQIEWRVEGVCRRRGVFTLGPWQVHLSDPFGLFSVTLDYPESQSILVYPPVVHLPILPLPHGPSTGAGRTSRRAMDATTNAASVRPYVSGDTLSRVHWPTTARLDKLMVKTFDIQPSGDLWIVLDLYSAVQAGEEEESTAEYGIVLAASLADRTLREGRAAGLIAYGSRPATAGDESDEPRATVVMPQKGYGQQWSILSALATVRAGGNWPLERVLGEMDRTFGRGMTLAIITPSCDPAWVVELLPPMRRGITPVVLLLDPVSFGGSGNVEAMTALLVDIGVSVHVIPQGTPFTPVLEHKRIGRPEYRVLSGTGRIVLVES